MNDYILEMKDITKIFPGVKALDNVTFSVKRGEIHCLIGENGSGKSTLMKVLSGLYPHGQYSGDIIFNGSVQKFSCISDSERVGIATIYQELALIPEMSVYENIYLGHEIKKGINIHWNETIVQASNMLKRVKLDINPSIKVKDLGVGKQQLVEIAKALSKSVSLLILDEPTAALNENDSENLMTLIKELKQQGVTCILISHKLKEVITIADTITVLRDGKSVCSLDTSVDKATEYTIIKHMVGREIEDIFPKRVTSKTEEKVLEVVEWCAYDPKVGRQILHNVNLNVKKGEIVGIAGLMGAGRTEFALSVFGNSRGYHINGDLYVMGKKVNFKNPSQAIKEGIAYVTEDRKGNGLILMDEIRQNITLANLKKLSNNKGVINKNEEINEANYYKSSLNIRAYSIAQRVGNLSGGNQQKVSLGKWLFVKPNLLILDEPTRGIDVGAKYEIYTLMNKLVEQGMSIIMISSELPEILGMSDRLYVMSDGEIVGEMSQKEATQEKVMQLAAN
ncbi:ATP-binding cassette domain-containing protein [Clostridium sp.]|uniref:ATP-binding cassette domain-containing protein n=1 Tax=Clostridium sp. TaxID=1506 RepID=UPI003D6C7B33